MQKGEDPYEILGVSYDVGEDEVKKAYRKLALTHHPDRQKDEEAKQKAHDEFARISAAYDVLTDPVKRYDWKQANENKLKGGSSHGTSGNKTPTATKNKASPSAGTPKRQNTMPSKHAPQPTQPQRPRSSSPKTRKPKHSGPPPPPSSSIFGRRSNNASNPHSQRPLNKKKQTRTQVDDSASVHSTRSTQTAPVSSSSRKAPAPAASPNPSASYRTTRGSKEFASPPATASAGAASGRRALSGGSNHSTNGAATIRRPTRSSSVGSRSRGTTQPPAPAASPSPSTSYRTTRGSKEFASPPGTASAGAAAGRKTLSGGSNHSTSGGTATRRPTSSSSVGSKSRGATKHPKKGSGSPRSVPRPKSGRDGVGTGTRTTTTSTAQSANQKMQQPAQRKEQALSSKTVLHDTFGVFEKKLQQHFEQDYWESDWKKQATKGMRRGKVMIAVTVGNENDPRTVASMTTATKKEKRDDKLYDVKTVTKILRLDGSVDKICQASVVDKDEAKTVLEGSFTISREQALEKALTAKSKNRGSMSGKKAIRHRAQ